MVKTDTEKVTRTLVLLLRGKEYENKRQENNQGFSRGEGRHSEQSDIESLATLSNKTTGILRTSL